MMTDLTIAVRPHQLRLLAKCRIRLPNIGQMYKAERFLTEKALPRLKR